ncbi:UDP-N-acetylglucosamine 2-epimerase (non-hydrolyzing) [Cryomorpha ignava]|uniref:UDP-N-acetylglucosamine 2-epimerase (Non-hydrolyzing) n=1 Tax=Cryomorpha ignava TaxID=101383 RepID=A0A7K3WSK2_9FLAO|nr:UDP-N-acetylglucosamine 2-epimerase (non-hydrolyzing) [Cryomorpha ignava]NEN24051.1 UDP-N-acetylglucosamine 2-epimerase (non-hydrolyzing) [Cryomorpha ignava]
MENKKEIWIVVGTRPNFIKVTQFKRVAKNYDHLTIKIVHTGQHYDEKMANVFFDQFQLRPDVFLDIQPNHPAKQIADILTALTDLFLNSNPALVIVVGDVNSTLAAAIAANKCDIPIAHLESGLRSFDRNMPEEHNRLVADNLADLHFVTEDSGLQHLRNEQKPEAGIAFVGNTMIDTLVAFKDDISESIILKDLNLATGKFALVTLHRPSNVDTSEGVHKLISVLKAAASYMQLVFPIHPRTRNKITEMGLNAELDQIENLILTEPLGYLDFQKLVADCAFVLTDSGGIQEETTFLQKPCLTLRPNTERPSTIEVGTNVLLPFDVNAITPFIDDIVAGRFKKGSVPAYWDGKATERIMARIDSFFNNGF